MNCDPIASAYRWLEYLAFGRSLERCRCHYLGAVDRRRHALLLGDGDGRFLSCYLRSNPAGRVDSLDLSPAMLALSRQRANAIAGAAGRVRFLCGDARSAALSADYDLVVTHFFLDCLPEHEIEALAERVRQHARPQACWLVSEFRIPDGTLARPLGAALIRAMYKFFGLATGLETRYLPAHRPILARHGFKLRHQHLHLRGLLVSELWELPEFR